MADFDTLFPEQKTGKDFDSLFPASIDEKRKAATQGIVDSPIQDLIFGDETVNPVAKVLNGFGQGAEDVWGAGDLGFSKEHLEQMKKAQIDVDNWLNKRGALAKAANVALIRPAAQNLVTNLRIAAELADLALQKGPATAIGGIAGGVSAISPKAGAAVDYMLNSAMDPGAFATMEGILGGIPYAHLGVEAAKVALSPLRLVQQARDMRLIGRGEAGAAGTAPIEQPKPAVTPKPPEPAPKPVTGAPDESQALSGPQAAAPPTPQDLHEAVRQAAPELFEHYDSLVQQKDALEHWVWQSGTEGVEAPAAQTRLAELNAELNTIAPQVAQTYRETAARLGGEAVEPATQFRTMTEMLAARAEEGVNRPPLPEAPEGAPARTLEEQRQFIADDVAAKLVRAGRPTEEAQAAGALVAERYVTRAARFQGALGTAEQLYRTEGAQIRGPGAAAVAPAKAVLGGPQAQEPEIDNSHTVVSGANSSRDPNGPVYIDPSIPEFSPTLKYPNGQPVRLWTYIAEHETAERAEMLRFEQAFRTQHGREPTDAEWNDHYDNVAHPKVANVAEQAALRRDGVDIKAYNAEIDGLLEKVEHKKNENPPPDTITDPEADIGHHRSSGKVEQHPEIASLVDRGASAAEIETHPEIAAAVERLRAMVPTGTREQFDDPAWRAARTYHLPDGSTIQGWDNAVAWLQRQAEGFAQGPTEDNRHAVFVLGPPASGKSMVSNPLAQHFRAAVVDADEAKKIIPEYQGGVGTWGVHEESSLLAKDVYRNLLLKGTNVVLPKVGDDAASIARQMALLKEAGYTVDIVHVSSTPEIAARRNVARFLKTGRLVAPDFLREVGDKPRDTAYSLRGDANEFADIDTSEEGRLGIREAGPTLADAIRAGEIGGPPPGRGLAGGPETPSLEEVATPRPIPSPILNGVVTLSPDELLIDANRFQFKEGGDQYGVTDRLKGVKQWDPIKAGMVLVWEDRDGKRYLVDGHQRVGLAKRIAAEDPNQKPMLNGYIIREVDGIPDSEARVLAAAKNIAEGTGTALDAAKILRERPDLLDTLPPRDELVRQATNLAKLTPDAFRMAVNEVVPQNQAAIVGALAPKDGQIQMALLDLLAKTEPENITQAESIVRQGLEAGMTKEVQHTLFGEEEVAKNLYFERAKVLDRALLTIRRDKAIFSTLVKERETIEATGSQLAHDVNERRANADAFAVQILQTLANRKGPIGDALNFAARQAKHDGKYVNAVRTFVDAIRREAESGDLARVADGARRSLDEDRADGGESAAIDRIPANLSVEPKDLVKELFQHRNRNLAEERESMGQMAFPGTERLSQAELAARRSAAPLRPTAPQEAPTGLFGEAARQVELALPPKPEAPTLEAGAAYERGPEGLQQGAPGVPGEQPARRAVGASPIRRPRQLPLFGGGGSELDVRQADGGPLPPVQEPAVPRPGEGVTGVPPRSGGVNTPRPDKPAVARTVKDTEQRIAERSRSNYRITPEDHVGEGSPKEKVNANLEAIRVLKTIEDETRGPTAEEKAVLVKYTGWGAFAQQMFRERDPAWAKERKSLQTLLSDEELESARASTPNAHFTSPEVVSGMWQALDHLGFRGGLALEPSAGVGHFIGLIPDGMAPKTAWTAVELDSVTARIAKALYQGAEVNAHGFEDLKRPSNYYDLAISNVPFGDYSVREKAYGAFPIHDFFFVKSLDKVRPGGVVSFITSRYTMDKIDPAMRKILQQSADLVGAIRLPGGREGAFAANAGTEVTTDILFLRKKIPGETPFPGNDWTDLKEIQTPEGPTRINQYFADHPDMMLGEMRLQGTQYREAEPVLIGSAEGIADRIAAAARKMPPAFTERTAPPPETIQAIDIDQSVKDGAFFAKDGKIYQRQAGVGAIADLSAEDEARVAKLIGIRDVVNNVMAAQLRGENAEPLREQLRTAYDAFVQAHGPINREVRTVTSRIGKDGEPIVLTKFPNAAAFRKDPDAFKVRAIENYDRETDTATRAAIQDRDVIDAPKTRQINGPADALAASLDEKGGVDLDHIGQALKLETYDDVTQALGDLIYHNPDGRHWETADKYLSGDVVKKLEEARSLALSEPAFLRNVAALEKVQPTPLHAHDITAQFGAPWIPAEDYKAFFESLGARNPEVALAPITKEWRASFRGVSRDAEAKYATPRVALDDIAEAAMNNRQISVYDKEPDGSRTINQKATDEARIKTELLKEAFTGNAESGIDGWVWSEPERTERLEAVYNRTFNNLVARKFDGSHQTLPGLNPDFAGRQHRLDAVWRMVQNGNTLLAHVVGSGKTVTMISGGMEMKRLGLINKPAYVVPNHMLEQFSREFIQAYPSSKILVAQREEMTRENRKAFIAKAAANDWDGIIITHDAFGRVNMAQEFRQDFVRSQMEELERAIQAEVDDSDKNAPTVKAMEKMKKRLGTKLANLMAEERKDEGVTFEESGIDHLFVDEAHLFKNLAFITRMQRVKGLAQGDAQRAEDLFLKIQYLEQKRPGRSAVFATGTPVSNTMAELWTMMRYLELDKLKERGLDTFDAWASTFGQIKTNTELSADGRTFKDVASFSRFVNIPELISIYSEVADTKTADMLNLPRPVVRTRSGAPGVNIVEAEPSPREEQFIDGLVRLAEQIKGQRMKPGDPNMASIATAGRKAATDGRLIGNTMTDRTVLDKIGLKAKDFSYNENGKIAAAVDNISRIYHEGEEPGTVQAVFLDMGTPKSKVARPKITEETGDEGMDPAEVEAQSFDLYSDLKGKLIDQGIPSNEIAFIHDAPTDDKKARLFDKVRRSEVRVLVGSTGKMGTGVNVQDRLIAMHHLDAPWKPAEVEQRDGRIVRQGNLNPAVQIYRYVTKRSFDAFMWQKLDTKSKFIGQVLSGTKGSRIAEDIDNPLPEAAEMKAAASGDPRILEHAEIDRQVRALTSQRRVFDQTKDRATWELKTAKSRITQYESALPNARADADKAAVDLSGENFKVTLNGQPVADRFQAGKAIIDRVVAMDPRNFYTPKVIDIGQMAGFEMKMILRGTWTSDGPYMKAEFRLDGANNYTSPNDAAINPEANPIGLIRRYENILTQIRDNPDRLNRSLAEEQMNVSKLERTVSEPWAKDAEYKAALQKLDGLTKELKGPKHPDVTEAEGEAKVQETEAEREREYAQSQLGKVTFKGRERPIITLAKTADASTFIHETGHVFLEELMRDAEHEKAPDIIKNDAQTTLRWLGVDKAENIKTSHHEKFARGFEQYLREGVAPSKELAGVFARFRDWLLRIYQTLKGLGSEITPEIRGVFDRLLAETPQRTIIAPEVAKRPDLQDIHESDARLTEPHHAEAAGDAVVAEEARQRASVPPDIIDEHSRGAAEIGTSAVEPAPLGKIGQPSEAQPTGEPGGPEVSPQPPSSGNALPEGPRLRVGQGEAGKLEVEAIGPHVPLDSMPDKLTDKVGNIRLENLNTPADVNEAIRALYRENKERLDSATRGRVGDQAVMDLADAMGVNPSIVANNMDRLRAMSLEDNVPLAARVWLMRDVFTKLAAEVSRAMQGDDVAAFAEARQRFLMAHETLSGITAEIGRGLRAFRSMRGEVKDANLLAAMLKEETGKTLFQLRQEMALGRAAETPAQVARMVNDAERSTYQKVRSGIISYVINNLISGPVTHATYMAGNTMLQLWRAVPVTGLASIRDTFARATGRLGPGEGVYAGEVGARLYGMLAGLRDGWVPSYNALKTGVAVMKGDPSGVDLFSSEIAYRPQAIPGRVGYVLETPSRAVTAIHTMHYGMNYEAEISSMAYRDAMGKGLEQGSDAFNAHVAEYRQNPPESAVAAAHQIALDQVLMHRPQYGSAQYHFQQFVNNNLAAKLVMPFVQIGSNILRGGLIESTPAAFLSKNARDNLLGRNGRAAQSMQYSQVVLGTGLAISTVGLAMEGYITGGGPSDPKQREVLEMTGWKPYSLKIGGEYIPYRKYLSVLGPLVAGAADVYEVGHALSEKGLTDAAAALTFGFAEVVMDETWMRGLASTIDAVRHWDRDGGKYLRNFSMEFLPFSIGMRQVASLMDPTWRSVRSEMDALRAHIPGLSQTLHPVRDLWGEPQRGGVMMAPSAAVNDPATIALQKAEYYPARIERKIRGVELSDQQYDDLTRIAGRDAHMHIQAMVSNPGFDLLPQEIRKQQLKDAIEGSRERARSIMLMNPDLLAQAIALKRKAQGAAVH